MCRSKCCKFGQFLDSKFILWTDKILSRLAIWSEYEIIHPWHGPLFIVTQSHHTPWYGKTTLPYSAPLHLLLPLLPLLPKWRQQTPWSTKNVHSVTTLICKVPMSQQHLPASCCLKKVKFAK